MSEMNEKNTVFDETGIREQVKIKKHLSRPKNRAQKRHLRLASAKFEKKYSHRLKKDTMTIKTVSKAIVFVLFVALLFWGNFHVKSHFSAYVMKWIPLSYGVTVITIGLSLVVLFEEKKQVGHDTDPITDYFLLSKQLPVEGQSVHHNRVNTSFLMISFLKLFKKEELAIHDGKFVYGVMKGPFSKEETALLNFMMDHDIRTVDDFLEVLKEKGLETPKKELFYQIYKDAVVEMAEDQGYINHQLHKAKRVLLFMSFVYVIVSVLLFSKGQGDIASIATLLAQGITLWFIGKNMYAYSSTGQRRVNFLRRRRNALVSEKQFYCDSLMYGYLFKREERVLRRIQKSFKLKKMNEKTYQKFSESFNGFEMIVNELHR